MNKPSDIEALLTPSLLAAGITPLFGPSREVVNQAFVPGCIAFIPSKSSRIGDRASKVSCVATFMVELDCHIFGATHDAVYQMLEILFNVIQDEIGSEFTPQELTPLEASGSVSSPAWVFVCTIGFPIDLARIDNYAKARLDHITVNIDTTPTTAIQLDRSP